MKYCSAGLDMKIVNFIDINDIYLILDIKRRWPGFTKQL